MVNEIEMYLDDDCLMFEVTHFCGKVEHFKVMNDFLDIRGNKIDEVQKMLQTELDELIAMNPEKYGVFDNS